MSRDLSRFESADTQDLVAYLTSLGWTRPVEQPSWTTANVWVSPDDDSRELLVPTQRGYSDYARLVYDVCAEVGDTLDVEPLRVLGAINAIAFDTIRLRVGVDVNDDSIPLAEGVGLVEHARSMFSAAAASAVEPRRNHPSRRPPAAEEYVSGLRMAPTEQGSFIVAIRSPVGPVGKQSAPVSDEDSDSPLFKHPSMPPTVNARNLTGRDVVQTLIGAVDVAEAAAGEYIRTRALDAFDEGVMNGVSANLCHALASIKRSAVMSVGLSVAWSPKARVADNYAKLGSERLLQSTTTEVLELAAAHLRQGDDPDILTVSGLVSNLRRTSGQMVGTATIRAEVHGIMRQIRIVLPVDDYLLAIRAHETGRRLACTGRPRASGRYLNLESPTNVQVE